jgi:plastocyanin
MIPRHWSRTIFFLSSLLLVLSGLAVAIDAVRASPAPTTHNGNARAISDNDDDDEDDDDDDDDDSGHGSDHDDDDREDDNSGSGGGDHDHDDDDDDDGRGDVARPVIPPAEIGDVVIEIVDERFQPAEVTIEAGQRVTFINLDDDEHTATGIGFDTGTLDPGDWRTVTFERGGESPFTCQFHPDMRGSVMVRGGTASPVASPVASPLALTPEAEGGDATNEITVSILDFTFDSSELEITVGTTVTWINDGATDHTVSGPFGDSGALEPGESYSFTFSDSGTFDYVCQFHPQMTGQVVVT